LDLFNSTPPISDFCFTRDIGTISKTPLFFFSSLPLLLLLLSIKLEIRNTNQGDRAEDIHVKRVPPLLGARICHFLHGIQSSVVDDEAVQTAPAGLCKLDGFPGDGEVGEVAGQDLDVFRAILIVELVEGGMGPRDQDQLVAAGEQVVCHGLADALVWISKEVFCRN